MQYPSGHPAMLPHQQQLPQHPPLQPLGRTPLTTLPTAGAPGGIDPVTGAPAVIVKNILTSERAQRAKTSMGQYGPSRSMEAAVPPSTTPGALDRQWSRSQPNLYQVRLIPFCEGIVIA